MDLSMTPWAEIEAETETATSMKTMGAFGLDGLYQASRRLSFYLI